MKIGTINKRSKFNKFKLEIICYYQKKTLKKLKS